MLHPAGKYVQSLRRARKPGLYAGCLDGCKAESAEEKTEGSKAQSAREEKADRTQ